jgi:hypothetical protein
MRFLTKQHNRQELFLRYLCSFKNSVQKQRDTNHQVKVMLRNTAGTLEAHIHAADLNTDAIIHTNHMVDRFIVVDHHLAHPSETGHKILMNLMVHGMNAGMDYVSKILHYGNHGNSAHLNNLIPG